MKMGNRRLKALDRLAIRVINKLSPTETPSNRAERRAAKKIERRRAKLSARG